MTKVRKKKGGIFAAINFTFVCLSFRSIKPHANGHNIVGCYMLRPFAHPAACCYVLFGVVVQSLKPVKRLTTCKRCKCWELLRPFARS